jgi:hypothetical protein
MSLISDVDSFPGSAQAEPTPSGGFELETFFMNLLNSPDKIRRCGIYIMISAVNN